MAASFPTSTKSFTTKASSDTIQASHVNDLQEEVVAIENDLRSEMAHDLLFTDATYDIGASGATRPRDLYLSRNATVGGTLSVTGLITASGGLKVGTITPTALAANTDNWSPTGLSSATVIFMSASTTVNLSGVDATNATTGRLLVLINTGSNAITLLHNSTSTATNRFAVNSGASLALGTHDCVQFVYDGAIWRQMGGFV